MISGLRRLGRSASRPEKIFRRLAVLSATPSIRPASGSGVLSTSTRKRMRTGMIISLLTSVKKLTMPSTTTLRDMPARMRATGPFFSTGFSTGLHGFSTGASTCIDSADSTFATNPSPRPLAARARGGRPTRRS